MENIKSIIIKNKIRIVFIITIYTILEVISQYNMKKINKNIWKKGSYHYVQILLVLPDWLKRLNLINYYSETI